MHIEQNRVNQPLTELEKQHLQQCDECQAQQQLLAQLTNSAAELELVTPPAQSWQVIKASMNQPKAPQLVQSSTTTKPYWHNVTAIAATVMLTMFGYLMWNNFQLQSQLEQVLQVNQSLEQQLDQKDVPGIYQADLLLQVRGVEQALDKAKSKAQKLAQLKQRQ
ncbi:MAG: hypothetical protein MJK04_29695, partial [Psychrosphaera sp.]|nr:hypothetical protein [Psychrosphaera sp.]